MKKIDADSTRRSEYVNPVYPNSFPDPYVLKFRGKYYAYATGDAPDGCVFPILTSPDLVHWYEAGSAMSRLPQGHPFYWAPEVFYDNGKFYLYYSVGNETLMHLRVAVSDRPDGGFVDAGRKLTTEDFAIDAHVFIDSDGSKYLFYATDFLEHSHIGTGTVVDRMIDWFTLEGKPRVVTRAKYDWQVYDPRRVEKGGVRWHTVEGPSVVKRKGMYFEMFSGGNWQNTTYGVSFARSPSLDVNGEWEQFADGEKLLPILRTLPGKVVGPGHNSIVRGPNNRELFAVYHCWTDAGRVMAIDRLDFAGKRMFATGATTTPQPAPFRPHLVLSDLKNSTTWGEWTFSQDSAVSSSASASLEFPVPDSFLLEADLKLIEKAAGVVGIRILSRGEPMCDIAITKAEGPASCKANINGRNETVILSDGFDISAFHLFRLELDHSVLRACVDSVEILHEKFKSERASSMSIFTENELGAIGSFALTEGFDETFDRNGVDNWDSISEVRVENKELVMGSREAPASISRRFGFEKFEVAAAVRVLETFDDRWSFSLELANNSSHASVCFMVDSGRPYLAISDRGTEEFAPLQDVFDWREHHQLRMVRTQGWLLVYIDDLLLRSFRHEGSFHSFRLACSGSRIGADSVRLTRI